MMILSPEVRQLATDIATSIRTNGHYQGVGDPYDSEVNPTGPCCIYANPAMHLGRGAPDWELEAALKHLCGVRFPLHWNDSTPTHAVLWTLDKIATTEQMSALSTESQ